MGYKLHGAVAACVGVVAAHFVSHLCLAFNSFPSLT
jgi:hypothetical protein